MDRLTYEAELMSLIAISYDGRMGREMITGETPDISEYLDYVFYDWVSFWDQQKKLRIQNWSLVRSLSSNWECFMPFYSLKKQTDCKQNNCSTHKDGGNEQRRIEIENGEI